MGKLELKHILGYLLFGLRVYIDSRIVTLNAVHIDGETIKTDPPVLGYRYCAYDDFKPILKPLSDLIENILDDGNDANYRLSEELCGILNTNDCSNFVRALVEDKYYAIDVRIWPDLENWLNSNFFDWKYKLIEKGLAININTIEL